MCISMKPSGKIAKKIRIPIAIGRRQYMRYRYRDYNYKKPSVQKIYKSKSHLGIDLLRKFRKAYPDYDLPVALDSGFTNPNNCHILNTELGMTYVGFLKGSIRVVLAGSVEKELTDFAQQLKAEHQETGKVFQKTTLHYKGQKETYYTYCKNHRIKNYKKKQRLVISFKKEDLSDTPKYTICNRLNWYASSILTIRRHRWPVETYHQEGKAEGLESYHPDSYREKLNCNSITHCFCCRCLFHVKASPT